MSAKDWAQVLASIVIFLFVAFWLAKFTGYVIDERIELAGLMPLILFVLICGWTFGGFIFCMWAIDRLTGRH